MKATERLIRLMKSPIGILSSAVIGISTGVLYPFMGDILGPIGDVFINLLKLCVIPIVLASISLSLAQFISAKQQGFLKIVIIFVSVIAFCGFAGVITATFTSPGKDISHSSSETLEEIIEKASMTERGLQEPIVPKLDKGIVAFILSAIPSNVFTSLADNQTFQILVFSILLGLALGVFLEPKNLMTDMLNTIYTLFSKSFNLLILFLPLTILCLTARDATKVGTDVIVGMTGFIGKCYLTFLILFVLGSVIIMIRTRTGVFKFFSVMKYPIFIAIGTQNSIAAIPASINSMREFGVDKSLTDLLVPLGTVLGRYGNIIYLSFAAIFVIQLYNISLIWPEYLYIMGMSILAGIATAGQTGALTLPMLGIILEPLGVPFSAVFVIFLVIDPIMDIGRSLCTVHTNCTLVSMIATRPNRVSG